MAKFEQNLRKEQDRVKEALREKLDARRKKKRDAANKDGENAVVAEERERLEVSSLQKQGAVKMDASTPSRSRTPPKDKPSGQYFHSFPLHSIFTLFVLSHFVSHFFYPIFYSIPFLFYPVFYFYSNLFYCIAFYCIAFYSIICILDYIQAFYVLFSSNLFSFYFIPFCST